MQRGKKRLQTFFLIADLCSITKIHYILIFTHVTAHLTWSASIRIEVTVLDNMRTLRATRNQPNFVDAVTSDNGSARM